MAASSKTLQLEDLIALNDEITALTRAEVPLDQGLSALGPELQGRLGTLAKALSERLAAGEDLSQALGNVETPFPPVYLAVVKAGLKAGCLPIALQGIAATARRIAHVRRVISYAIVYPIVVVLFAYALLMISLQSWIPIMVRWNTELNHGPQQYGLLPVLAWLGETSAWWGPVVFVLGIVAGVIWWRRGLYDLGTPGGRFIPNVRSLAHAGRMATFADVLALLTRHTVPLPEALTLAGDASGDQRLVAACNRIAERLRQGERLVGRGMSPHGIPPVLYWLILTGQQQSQLATSLEQAADDYRLRIRRIADWLSVYLPVYLTGIIGGSAVLIFSVVTLAPWLQLLRQMVDM